VLYLRKVHIDSPYACNKPHPGSSKEYRTYKEANQTNGLLQGRIENPVNEHNKNIAKLEVGHKKKT